MSLPDLLRHERELRGVTLEQLADETKIPVTRLAALEDPRQPVDGDFYRRAQLRTYARALRLDERAVLAQLDRDFLPPVPAAVTPELEKHRTGRAYVPAVLAVACVVAVVAAVTLVSREQPNAFPVVERRAPQPPVSAAPQSGQSPAVASSGVATAGRVEPAVAAATTSDPLSTSSTAASGAAPVTGTQLIVTSDPPGARVTVDGIGWGVTPVTIRYLPAGVKRLRVTNDGYSAVERLIAMQPDGATRVSIRLQPSASFDQPAR
jgi:cytoskeletal protein RodZ